MRTVIQDVRFAVRNLRRSPGFPLAAIATLALGVGATTAIFSTVNAALLKPLPYPQPENLYSLRTTLTDGRVTTGLLSPAEIVRLNDPALSIVRAAGLLAQEATLLRSDGTPLRTRVYAVSEGFFDVFGLPLSVGPGFVPEQLAENSPPPVVISHRIWTDLFGADPAIAGKPIQFAEFSSTIAGVAPIGFDTPHGADFWFGLRLDPQGVNHSFEGFMRVRPGTTIDRARSELSGVMTGIARDLPASAASRVYVVQPLLESIVGNLAGILIIVLSATALLLVLSCVNVTNLMLARGATRAREMAVRVALGAGRRRIVRQLVTESLVLATAGALVGVFAAYAGVRLLLALGASRLPRLDAVPFDGRVFLFALVVLVVSGVLVGFAPAFRLARTDVRTLMNEGGRSATAGRGTSRWLDAMTIAQIALAIMLVAGAGWLIRGFASLRATDPGFVADRRLVFDISLQGEKYREVETVVASSHDLLERLRAVGGVEHAGFTTNFPLRSGAENSLFLTLRGEAMDPARPKGSRQRIVSPGFFDAMGITLLAGRDFSVGDRQDTLRVAVVNETFARLNVPGRDPIGVRFSSGYPVIDPDNEVTIVGVVEDVRQKSLHEAPEPAFYTPHAQVPSRRQTVVVASRLADPSSLRPIIREAVRKVDPQIAIEFETVREIVSSTVRRQELGMTLMLIFGAAAVALAAVGIYGVIAHAATERRNEVATRLALGATPGSVFWLVLKQGHTLAAIGTAIGLVAAYLAGRLVASRLYEVQAGDPLILGTATVLVVAIALLATMIPALRAARLDPARVLRPD